MPFAVCENLTFSGIEPNRAEVSNKPVLTMEDSNTVDSSISHFEDINNSGRMDLDIDATESNSDSNISDTTEISENVSDNVQVAGVDNACSKYKTVSLNIENMTKTTVINTSFNIISQSTVRDIEKELLFNPARPVFVDPFDKSRVIVQVLTSNAKSRTIIENQTRSAPPNVSNFRDDVCRMLSKAEPSELDDNEYNSAIVNEEIIAESPIDENHINVKESSKEAKLKQNNTNQLRSRRKRNYKYYFLNGRGLKFSEIEYVSSNVRSAPPRILRILHYLLYDTYGCCSTGLKLSQTLRNILHFCGYPFNRDSEDFQRKINCLSRLPLPILNQIHRAIIGNTCNKRTDMVLDLVEFLMEPHDIGASSRRKNQKDLSTEEYTNLMNIAAEKPLPMVLVKKLNNFEIEELQNQMKSEYKENQADIVSEYQPPVYILNGPGKKLKSFPKVGEFIQNASKRTVEILHFVLYGRMEQVEICRKNILEFSGYLPCQKDFINQARTMLLKLGPYELAQLCKILCLRARTLPRSRKIDKIMKYLSAPIEPRRRRVVVRAKKLGYALASCFGEPGEYGYGRPGVTSYKGPSKCGYRRTEVKSCGRSNEYAYGSTNIHSSEKPEENRYKKTEGRSFGRTKEDGPSTSTILNDSKSLAEMEESETGPKLRDFSKISSNVECAAPSDLVELSDLLFIKPSDESEIHQKILDFTGFKFTPSSLEYHYRKTLMHYMGFCVIRKIAHLLDIENREKAPSQEDLSASVLNFLMEMKLPLANSSKMNPSKLAVKNKFWRKRESPKANKRKAEFQEDSVVSFTENKRKTNFQNETTESLEENWEEFDKETMELIRENERKAAEFQEETVIYLKENKQKAEFEEEIIESQKENKEKPEFQEETIVFQTENKMNAEFQKETIEFHAENNMNTEFQKETIESQKENKETAKFQKEKTAESQKGTGKITESIKETIMSRYFQLNKMEIKKNWSVLNGAKSTDTVSSSAPQHPSDHKNSSNTNQIFKKRNKEVYIHRLIKASELPQSITKEKHDPLENSWSIQEDSTPLCSLIHHPSDEELKRIIYKIIEKELWSITMGDLVRRVYNCFPKVNILYREDFIKTEARQILSKMRSNAVETLNNMLIIPSS